MDPENIARLITEDPDVVGDQEYPRWILQGPVVGNPHKPTRMDQKEFYQITHAEIKRLEMLEGWLDPNLPDYGPYVLLGAHGMPEQGNFEADIRFGDGTIKRIDGVDDALATGIIHLTGLKTMAGRPEAEEMLAAFWDNERWVVEGKPRAMGFVNGNFGVVC